MGDFFTVSVLAATLASAIRLATPFLLAALGETVGQRSGVLNLGVEGVMLLGAFFGYWTVLRHDHLAYGLAAGAGVGLVMGAVYAVVTLVFRAEQGISGIGIYLFGLGLSELLYRQNVGTPLPIRPLGAMHLPVISDIRYLGDIVSQSGVVYLTLLAVPLITYVLNRTRLGLDIRAVGDTPEAADSLGVSVLRTRTITILFANALAGLAGAALALQLATFQQNVTNGMGFIAVALVYFGAWRPAGVLFGSLLYGLVTATVNQLKTLGVVNGDVASLATMAPAVLTVLVLVVVARRNAPQPAALTVPFVRDE